MMARDGAKPNPSPAKTEKSPLSEPDLKQESRSNGSMTGQNSKPSVREKLNEYKARSLRERETKTLERGVDVPVEPPKVKPKER